MMTASDDQESASQVEMDGRLNIAERMVARVGAWAGSLAVRCQPPAGPFFLADGRMCLASALYEQDMAEQGTWRLS